MREFLTTYTDWLSVLPLPAYAPELNPAEGVWAHLKSRLGTLASCGLDPLTGMIDKPAHTPSTPPDLPQRIPHETGPTLEPLQPQPFNLSK